VRPVWSGGMLKAFWRTYYRIKYWRVFLRPQEYEAAPAESVQAESAQDPQPPRATLGLKLFLAAVFLGMQAIGLGFGYLSWVQAHRVADQWAVDTGGEPVVATVFGTKIEKIEHSCTGGGSRNGGESCPQPSYFCHIGVTYREPRTYELLRKQFRLEDDTVCKRYKNGDPIRGKLLPDNPAVMVLDEGRLSVIWVPITFAIFLLFAVLPLFLLLRWKLRRMA
jgi:hypothetical protein